MVRYRNRYGDIHTFTKLENGNVLWEGDFEYIRAGHDFIDPSGGPFIKIGQLLSQAISRDKMNVIVEGFLNTEKGIIIQTRPHEYDPTDFSHLGDR